MEGSASDQQKTPQEQLEDAARSGNLTDVRRLTEKGNVLPGKCLALHWASINGRCDVVRYLLGNGCDVNTVGGNLRSSPLYWATYSGKLDTVMLLMKSGADPSIPDCNGVSPLHLASHNGDWKIVAYLVACGQDIDVRDTEGMTPLMIACRFSKRGEMTQFFIRRGAALQAVDTVNGNTPLHLAIQEGNHLAIEQLLKAGVRLDVTNAAGLTPLECVSSGTATNQTLLNVKRLRDQRANTVNALFHCLRLDPIKSRQVLSSIIPGICIGLVAYSATFSSWMFMILSWICIAMGTATTSFYLHTDHPAFEQPLLYGLYLGTKFWMFVTWFFLFWPYVNILSLNITMLVLTILLFRWNIRSVTSDPGYLRPSRSEWNKTVQKVLDGGNIELELCQTCFIKKPLRSKHCVYCDKCVSCFDHHCPFIMNCVGERNHRYFVQFLAVLGLINLIFMYGAYRYYSLSCLTVKSGAPMVVNLSAIGTCSPWVFTLSLQSILYTLWIFALLASQLYQISRGFTTNEYINRARYDHFNLKTGQPAKPFHRGILQNFANFFRCSCLGVCKVEQHQWHSEYDIGKYTDSSLLRGSSKDRRRHGPSSRRSSTRMHSRASESRSKPCSGNDCDRSGQFGHANDTASRSSPVESISHV